MTGTTTTATAATAVHDYLAAWNETDADARRAAIGATFTEDARYVDPLADVTGHAGLAQLIAGVQQQFAGLEFSLVGEVDAHHDVVRFRWGLGPAGDEPLVIGFDVARMGPDGRIAYVHGFLDKVPAA